MFDKIPKSYFLSQKLHTQQINKGKVNIYNNLFVFTFTSIQFSLLETFKNNIIPYINPKMSYDISVGFQYNRLLHKKVNKEEIILGGLDNDINYKLEVLYSNCLDILQKSLDSNYINYGEVNNIYIELKPRTINKPLIKNRGGLSKLYQLYNYIICICLIYFTFSNPIFIRLYCFLSFYFFMAIFSDIPLFLTNVNICTNVNWSFDGSLELNDIKFNSNKIITNNEIIIDSKDDISNKKFTTNKYFSVFNFNNTLYIPSFISKSSFFVSGNDSKCLEVNEGINSNLIVPYKAYTSVSREALINHINQQITKGIKFNSSVLGTFTTMEDYIKSLNNLNLDRKDIYTYNWNIIRNNHIEIDTNFIKLADRLDIKVKEMYTLRKLFLNLMKDLGKITQEIVVRDKLGNEFHEHYFEVVNLRNSLTKENIGKYIETLKIYDSSPEELNRIKEEQLTNTDSHWKALDKADDMIKKLKERISFFDALVKENKQGVLDIRHNVEYRFLDEDCSICKDKVEKTEGSSSNYVVYHHNVLNLEGPGSTAVVTGRDNNWSEENGQFQGTTTTYH